MGKAKDIHIAPISASDAKRIVSLHHYSGKTVNNSQLHLGVFLDGKCSGAMQFGPSLDKRKLQGLVAGTQWNGFIELNRMAFADTLPRNSESRAIAYAMRWIRATYPWIEWVVSFADATQCGDGAIYRASGFVLTGIKANTQIWEGPAGDVFSRASLTDGRSRQQQQQRAMAIVCRTSRTKGGYIQQSGGASMKPYKEAGWQPKRGFQLRYIRFLDPAASARLTVPVLPFSEIDRLNAGMYRGEMITRAGSIDSDAPVDQTGEGGAGPTSALYVA